MKIRRILYAVFAICVAAAFPIVLWAGVASAQVSSGCTVTFNGGNANTYSSPGSALEVDKDSVVRVQGRSAGTVTGHHIELEFAGVRWTVSSGADNGATWHPAVGRESWTFEWTPSGLGTFTIQSRAVDDSGNVESPTAGISVTVISHAC